MKSFEPREDWGWCYIDELFFESLPGSFTTEWCGALGVTPGENVGDETAQETSNVNAS